MYNILTAFGDVTQLVEYLFHAEIVIGSNPVITIQEIFMNFILIYPFAINSCKIRGRVIHLFFYRQRIYQFSKTVKGIAQLVELWTPNPCKHRFKSCYL